MIYDQPPVNVQTYADLDNLSYFVSHAVRSVEEEQEFKEMTRNREIIVNVLTSDGYILSVYAGFCR
jgi:hypothetical protein